MTDLLVPNVSISMQEVQVLRWLVDDGALVRSGETVVEIETDKATVEVEANCIWTLAGAGLGRRHHRAGCGARADPCGARAPANSGSRISWRNDGET